MDVHLAAVGKFGEQHEGLALRGRRHRSNTLGGTLGPPARFQLRSVKQQTYALNANTARPRSADTLRFLGTSV
jgi:hypothetical protein